MTSVNHLSLFKFLGSSSEGGGGEGVQVDVNHSDEAVAKEMNGCYGSAIEAK